MNGKGVRARSPVGDEWGSEESGMKEAWHMEDSDDRRVTKIVVSNNTCVYLYAEAKSKSRKNGSRFHSAASNRSRVS